MSRELIFQAAEKDEGRLVSEVIRTEFGLVAHDLARAKYRTENGITVNGVQVMVNHRLSFGERLIVRLEGEMPAKTVPAEGPLDILYEDEDVICLNKPAGTVAHPSHGHFSDTLSNYLAWYYVKKGDPHEIRTAGRLDKDTSGIIMFAKSRTAVAHLVEQSETGLRSKTYLALAEGVFDCPEGSVEAPISREYEEKIRRVVREDGHPARTRYRVIRQYPEYAVLSLSIYTGRTHQIRVHMQHIGHPLLGDPIYGRTFPGLERAALHAWKASFLQPFSGERITLCAPVPADMSGFINDQQT